MCVSAPLSLKMSLHLFHGCLLQVTKLYESHGLEAPMTICRKYMGIYAELQQRFARDPAVCLSRAVLILFLSFFLSFIHSFIHSWFYSPMPQARVEAYTKSMVVHFPLLFHKWFLQKYRDPTRWFECR
jgi:hypothetical protein